jgi:hypothetical protein
LPRIRTRNLKAVFSGQKDQAVTSIFLTFDFFINFSFQIFFLIFNLFNLPNKFGRYAKNLGFDEEPKVLQVFSSTDYYQNP